MTARAILLLLLLCPVARSVELQVRFGAVERMLAEQLFTQEGRRYVRGSKTARCNFAYLESPHVQSADGRLRIQARFTGRTAANLLGQCVGLGDAFDLTITATPVYHDGAIALRDVVVTSEGKTGFYIRRVCTAMASSLQKDFRYALHDAVRKILEDPANQPGYQRDLHNFTVTEVRVAADALVFVMDFRLTIR